MRDRKLEPLAFDDDDEPSSDAAPTLQPFALLQRKRESGVRVTLEDCTDDALLALIDRFELGDYLGALALSDRLLDERRVPKLLVDRSELEEDELDRCEAVLASFVDGTTPLEAVLLASELPMIEALRAICGLVEKRVLAIVLV